MRADHHDDRAGGRRHVARLADDTLTELLRGDPGPDVEPERERAIGRALDHGLAGICAAADERAAIIAYDAQPDETIAPRRWCRPLIEFIGSDEPSADDREDWIIRDVIPRGEPAIWAGPPKAGKTWAALDLAMCVARGTSWLDGYHENTLDGPARALVIALEDVQRRLRSRVWELARGYGITPSDPTLRAHLSISREPLRLPGDERAIASELRRERPRFVVVDSLTRVMVGDQNAIRDVAAFTAMWTRLCAEVGASIMFLHHTAKVGGESKGVRDPFDAVRGSGDLVAAARNVVVARPIDDAPGGLVSEVRIRGNLDLRRDRFALGFERTERDDGRWVARMVDRGDVADLRAGAAVERRGAREQRGRDERAERQRIAIDLAQRHGAVSKSVLAPAIGMSEGSAAAILRGLAADGRLVAAGQRGYVLAGGVQ